MSESNPPRLAADTPRETRASRALSKKFAAKHGEQNDCSKRTRIPAPRLSRIAAWKLFPRADEGARLEEEGIPVHWWDEPPLDTNQSTDSGDPGETLV